MDNLIVFAVVLLAIVMLIFGGKLGLGNAIRLQCVGFLVLVVGSYLILGEPGENLDEETTKSASMWMVGFAMAFIVAGIFVSRKEE